MASKPASVPSWATDATFTTSPEPGENGNPTKVDPGAPYRAQGWVSGLTVVGAYVNWLWNLLCLWCTYLNDLHNSAEFLNKGYTWTGQHRFDVGPQIGGLAQEGAYVTPRTRTIRIPVGLAASMDSVAITNGYEISVGAGGALFLRGDGSSPVVTSAPFQLPQGATIVDCRAAVAPNASDLIIELYEESSNVAGAGTQTLLAGDTATGGGGAVILLFPSPPALPRTVGVTEQYRFRINGGSSNVADAKVFWLEISYTETRATGTGS